MTAPCPTCGRRRLEQVSDATVIAIREAYAAGASQTDLARKYGLSQAFVSKATSGRIRPDVGGPITPTRRRNRSTTAP